MSNCNNYPKPMCTSMTTYISVHTCTRLYARVKNLCACIYIRTQNQIVIKNKFPKIYMHGVKDGVCKVMQIARTPAKACGVPPIISPLIAFRRLYGAVAGYVHSVAPEKCVRFKSQLIRFLNDTIVPPLSHVGRVHPLPRGYG